MSTETISQQPPEFAFRVLKRCEESEGGSCDFEDQLIGSDQGPDPTILDLARAFDRCQAGFKYFTDPDPSSRDLGQAAAQISNMIAVAQRAGDLERPKFAKFAIEEALELAGKYNSPDFQEVKKQALNAQAEILVLYVLPAKISGKDAQFHTDISPAVSQSNSQRVTQLIAESLKACEWRVENSPKDFDSQLKNIQLLVHLAHSAQISGLGEYSNEVLNRADRLALKILLDSGSRPTSEREQMARVILPVCDRLVSQVHAELEALRNLGSVVRAGASDRLVDLVSQLLLVAPTVVAATSAESIRIASVQIIDEALKTLAQRADSAAAAHMLMPMLHKALLEINQAFLTDPIHNLSFSGSYNPASASEFMPIEKSLIDSIQLGLCSHFKLAASDSKAAVAKVESGIQNLPSACLAVQALCLLAVGELEAGTRILKDLDAHKTKAANTGSSSNGVANEEVVIQALKLGSFVLRSLNPANVRLAQFVGLLEVLVSDSPPIGPQCSDFFRPGDRLSEMELTPAQLSSAFWAFPDFRDKILRPRLPDLVPQYDAAVISGGSYEKFLSRSLDFLNEVVKGYQTFESPQSLPENFAEFYDYFSLRLALAKVALESYNNRVRGSYGGQSYPPIFSYENEQNQLNSYVTQAEQSAAKAAQALLKTYELYMDSEPKGSANGFFSLQKGLKDSAVNLSTLLRDIQVHWVKTGQTSNYVRVSSDLDRLLTQSQQVFAK